MRRLLVLAALLFALPAHAVTIEWVEVGDPGNACDPQRQGCFGSVDYAYKISKYEITNAQYAAFLNAVAHDTDTYGLYNASMATWPFGGIAQSSISRFFIYTVNVGMGNKPVNYISFYDSLRFANWLHNGQPYGAQDSTTTEDGAYTLTVEGIEANSITRNPGATIFLTSEDEWYKAAYFNGWSYFDYPAGTDTQTTCAVPGPTANTANCDWVVGDLTDVGSYTGSASPYGTFDQGGNVWEWNEMITGTARGVRGGEFSYTTPGSLAASSRLYSGPAGASDRYGFRVAMIPEPTTVLLLACGLAGLAAAGRRRSLR